MVYLLIKCRLFLIVFLIILAKEKTMFSVNPGGSVVKNPPANAGELGLIPGLGRSPGEGNVSPLQYSCLGNPMDGGVWMATILGPQSVRHDWCDLARIHAQFVNVCFTINAKIHLNFFFKGRLKMFLPKDLLLMDSCFYLKCVYVCIFVQKPRVYKSHHFMNIFILTFENCSYIFSMALDCFILVKWIYIVPF